MPQQKKDVRPIEGYPTNDRALTSLNIYHILKTETISSVPAISKKTGLSEDVVAEYVNLYIKKDLVVIDGKRSSKNILKFNKDNKKFLGIGFSSKACYLTVIDLAGDIVSRERIKIPSLCDMKGRVRDVKRIIDEIENETKLKGKKFFYAGSALAERMKTWNVKNAEMLTRNISRMFGCNVMTVKEATAAAYGEREFGDKARGKDILYMHMDVGTGVVIKNETIFEAPENAAGDNDISYLRPWTQFNIVEIAKHLVNKGVGTNMVNMVNGEVDDITLDIVLQAAENKDEVAEDLVRRAGLALGLRAAYLSNMFTPEILVLGGGTERQEGGFVGFAEESAKRFFMKKQKSRVKIIPAVLGKESFSIGAAALCRRELFREV
ncbi:MAG: ROK family protein [Candidatus Omnitrophota bacterium]